MGDFFLNRSDQQITANRLIEEAQNLAASMRIFYDSNLDGVPDVEPATAFSYWIELNAPNETVYQEKINLIYEFALSSRIAAYFRDYRNLIAENFRRVAPFEYGNSFTGNRCRYGADYQLNEGVVGLDAITLIALQVSNQKLFEYLSDRPISVECDAPFYDPFQWCDTNFSEVTFVERGGQFYVGNLLPSGGDVSTYQVLCE